MGRKKKKKDPATLWSISIRCPEDHKLYNVSRDILHWKGWEAECDMCGSHGGVKVDFKCPGCGEHHEIELDSW